MATEIHALTMLKLDDERKLRGLTDLLRGKLSAELVDSIAIQKGLARVQKLLTQHFKGYFLVHKEAKFYYQEQVAAVGYPKDMYTSASGYV